MILHFYGSRWYVDVRNPETSDQLSFDLAYTLPRRLASGRVLVLTDNTKVFLSVIRKRWMRLLYEVECQRSSTLDRRRKAALQYEADQMRNCRFTTKPPAHMPEAHVYFLTPQQVSADFPPYATLYITAKVTAEHVTRAATSLQPNGMAIVYGLWSMAYEPLLQTEPEGPP